MSEQQLETTQAPVEAVQSQGSNPAPAPVQRSQNYTSARLAYDTLIASTKSFSHHFNNLTESERAEFKSLANHVKTLQKCNQAVSSVNQSRPVAPRRVPKTQPAHTPEGEQTQTSSSVPTLSQSSATASATTPVSRSKRSSRAKDTSPTAEVVAEVQAQHSTPVQAPTPTPASEQAQTQVPVPAKSQSKSRNQLKKQ